METVVMNIDEELQECIAQLEMPQKKSLLELIKSFVTKESKLTTTKEYNKELKESETKYQTGKSTLSETESSEASKWIGKPQTIEEYNKELEEAVAEVKGGEYFTQEEVKEMAKSW